MHLQPHWKVITIGDGDLSFSLSISRRFPDLTLCATVLDSEQQLRSKYELNAIDALVAAGHQVAFNADITKPLSFTDKLQYTFDVAIFQFPLVPNAGPRKPGQSWHQSDDGNLQNRKLLQKFLHHSGEYLLSKDGARLCYITSKDVKPYCDWNIEGLAAVADKKTEVMHYLGKMPFHPGEFPDYRVRNVDRDKQVKSTAAFTYVWSGYASLRQQQMLPTPLSEKLEPPKPAHSRYCLLCDIGPIENEQDWLNHLNSRQHKRREGYQNRWEEYLGTTKT